MDKRKQLYNLYKERGLISDAVSEDAFLSASEEQQEKLYFLGEKNGLFEETELGTFKGAWPTSKKKEDSALPSDREDTLSAIPGVGEVSLTGFTRGSRYDAAPVGATPEEVEAAQIQREEQAAPVVGREMINQYTPEAFDPVKERKKADIAAERDDLSGVSLGYVIDDLLDNTYLERFGEKISEDIEVSGVQAEVADLASIVSDSGKEYNEEDVKNLVEAYNKMAKTPPSQAMKSWDRDYEKNGKGIYAFMAATLSNPSAVREVSVRSLGGMLQSKKALTAGATGGGAALITGLGAIPTAMATANAVLDANLSFAEFLFEEAKKKGYKEFTEEAVISVLKDPEALRRARYRAVGRGAAIGIIDRATFGLAKGVVSSVARKTGVKGLAALTGTTVEMAGGSASEVAARLVADQEMDLKDIGFEAIGELGTAPVSVVTGLTSIPEYKINGQVVSGPKMAEAIRKAPDDSFSRMRVSIKNDEELYNAAKGRKDKLIVRKAVNETIKATVGRANKEDVDAIVELELKKQELSKKRGSKSREELKNIESQIDELYNKIESEDYAVQEQSTDEVPVQPDAAVSEEVEEGVPETKPEELTEQEEKELESLEFEEATTEDDIEYRSELVEKSRKNAPAEAEVVRISRDDSGNVIAGEIEFIQDGETVTEKIKIAPVEQGTQAPIEGTKLRDNIKKAIAKVFTKTDSRSFKNGKDMSEYAKEKYGQDIGQDEGARVFIKQDGSIEILVNEELADDTSFGHEVWHPILLKAFGDNQNKFTAFRKSINKTLRNNGYVELADNLDEFANQYKETKVPAEEYLAQLGGILTAANIDVANLTEADKTLLQQIKEIVNNIMVELTGQPVFLDDATPKDILDFMSTMSDMMARGEDISGFFKDGTKQQGVKTRPQIDPRLSEKGIDVDRKEKLPQKITPANETKVLSQVDNLLDKYPNALTDKKQWKELMSRVFSYKGPNGETLIPKFPTALSRMSTSVSEVLKELKKVSEKQRDLASSGLEGTKEIGNLYREGKMDETDTGLYFLWNIMSIGISPYPQESGFLRAVDNGIDYFIKKSANGEFLTGKEIEYDGKKIDSGLAGYFEWVNETLPKGVAGSGSKANLRSFGSAFLSKASTKIETGEFAGLTKMQALHKILSDKTTPTNKLRRKWLANLSGMSFNNKIFDFILLTTGRSDLFVIDRVRTEHFWDSEKLKKEADLKPTTSIYDGSELLFGKTKGAGYNKMLSDVSGMVFAELANRTMQPVVQEAYKKIGVSNSPDVGRFHWETWVASSSQEVSHGSIDAIVQRKNKGKITDAGIRQGKYGSWDFNFLYRKRIGKDFVYEFIDEDGNTYVFDDLSKVYEEISNQNTKKTYKDNSERFILKDKNENIIKRKTQKIDNAWYDQKGVNKQKYFEFLKSEAKEVIPAPNVIEDQGVVIEKEPTEVKTRAQKKVPSDYKKIASEKLTSKEFNAVRSSIKRTAPDSFAAEALDAIASKDDFDLGISSLNERVEEIKEDGVTFGNLVSLIAEDEEILDIKGLETSRDVADYLLNIGQVGRLQKMASRALAETRAQKWPTSLTQEQVDQKLKEAGIRTKTENDRFLEDEGKGNETQRNNIKTYDTFVGGILNSFGDDVRILDIGAGFGIGAMAAKKQNVADIYKTYEPFPSLSDGKWEKFSGTKKPNYTKESQVPKESADVIVSNAVLNVVPQDIRDGIVNLIGDSLAPGGKAYISVRGIKEEALAKALKNSKEGKGKNVFLSETEYYVPGVQGDYQKGFSPEELKAYVQDTLGSDYTVEVSKDSFWKNSSSAPKVVVSKKGEGVLTRAQKKASSERMQKELDGVIEKARKRGADKQRVYDDALAYLQGSKVYEKADDVAREKMVRDLNKKLGVKEKRVPKIFATRKNTDKVTVNEKKALLDMIRAQAKAAKNAVAAQRGIAKALNDELKMLFKKGFISTRQMKAIINKALSLNFFNDDHVVKFVEYVEKVYNNAEYAENLKNAESIKRKIKRFTKNKDLQAETRDIAKRFLEIEPFFAESIEEYLKIANQILEATSTTVGKVVEGEATVNFKQAMDYGVVTEYTDKTLEFQEEAKKKQLMDKNAYLVESGVLDGKMSLEEMKLVVQAIEENPDREGAAEKKKMIKDFVRKYYDSYKALISEMIRTQSDPFTGERIFLTKEQVKLVERFLDIDIETLNLKDAFRIIESINNFIVNQNTDGMLGSVEAFEGGENAKLAKKLGFKARRLRLFFSKKFGGVWAEQFEQLTLLTNRMFGGESAGSKWDKLSGLSDLMAVKNKAFSKYNKYVENYSKQFENIKDFNSLENIFARAMLAYVSRASQGSKIKQDAEFKKRKKNIETSIAILKKRGKDRQKKDAQVLEKVYKELLEGANTAQEVSSRSSKTNRLAVSYWQAAFSDIFDDMQRVSRGVYNTILERDFKYTPDTYSRVGKKLGDQESIEEGINSSAFFGINDNFDTKESGSMMQATKPQLAEDSARVVSFDFDSNVARALQAAIMDIETAPLIRKIDAFYNSKEVSEIVEEEDLEVLRNRVAGYIRATKRKEFSRASKLGDISKSLNYISTFGAAKALAGLSQIFKQTIPVMGNTLINSGGRTGLGDVLKAKDFIDNSGYAIGLRGIASQADIQTMNKILKRAEESSGMKVLNYVRELNQLLLEKLVAKPDVFVARASWLAYYKQNLAKQGLDTNVDWDTHELNKEAADYAQRKVDKQQNYSDADLAGDLLRSKDQNVALVRKSLFPFATFMLNKRSALIGDVSTLQNKLASKEDKKSAALSLMSNAAEMIMFHKISIFIGSTIYGVLASALAGGDEEKEAKKEERSLKRKMYSVKNAVNEYISPIPGLTDEPIDLAINKLLDIVGIDEKYQLPEGRDEDIVSRIGMIGISASKIAKSYDFVEVAITGKINGKEMSKEDKESMRIIAGIYGIYAMGALPADLGSISQKVYYIIANKYKGRKKKNPFEIKF